MKKVVSKEAKIKHSEEYIEFLKIRLASKNYKASVSEEEFKKTEAKYDKEKFARYRRQMFSRAQIEEDEKEHVFIPIEDLTLICEW